MSPKPKAKTEEALSALLKRRQMTNYAAPRITGFAPIPRASGPDGRRITSPSGWRVLSTILEEATGRRVGKTEAFQEETAPIGIGELAALAFVELRTAERELKTLGKRKIVKITKLKKGLYIIQPLFRTWATIPDYVPEPLEEPGAESDDEPLSEDPAQNSKEGTVTQVTTSPVKIAAGKKSKPVKVECGVTALQFHADIDAECSAMVQGGVLLVSLKQRWQAKDGIRVSNGIKQLTLSSRHGRREERPNGTLPPQADQPKKRVTHPRAEELSSLFDPLLLKSCGKSLSEDPVMLLAACEAIGAADHNFLVKCVIDRSARYLRVNHVKALCREIAANWAKVKGLPPEEHIPTRSEIDAMVEAERKELAAKRAAARRGKVA